MNDIDSLIASTQRTVTFIYVGLFAAALIGLGVLWALPGKPDPTATTLLVGAIGTLAALITQQSQFWFARSRGGGVPDPIPQASVTPAPGAEVAK